MDTRCRSCALQRSASVATARATRAARNGYWPQSGQGRLLSVLLALYAFSVAPVTVGRSHGSEILNGAAVARLLK